PAKHKGGQVVYGSSADAQTANPVLSHDTASGAIINLMFQGVVQTSPEDGSPAPSLAKSWDISQDGITYTFTLNDGIKWHDGQPFSADDVKFTYDLFLNPEANSPRTSTLAERIAKVETNDPAHVTVTLKTPNSSFLVSNMAYGVVPQHILKDVQPKDIAQHDFSTGKKGVTIGTGPFMFEDWVKDDHITLVKNPSYWQGEPNLEKWIYKVVPNTTVSVQQLKTGELDYASIEPSDIDDMKKQDNVTVHTYDTYSATFWCFQLDPSKTTVFQDKEVRQALLYALDRKAMVEAIDFGYSTVAIGTIPTISWAYNPDGIKLHYPYDMDKANQLLDQAGWAKGSDGIREKNGRKLGFKILSNSGSQPREQYTSVFQQQWKKLGVDATPELIEWNSFLDRITKQKNFDLFFEGFSWGVDPDQTAWFATSSQKGGLNRGNYSNPQVDKLLQDGLATTDQAKRKDIYTQLENIVMDDLPYVVTDFPKAAYGVNKRMHNYFPNAINSTFNAHQWWVDS
ncbi:MAG TPA: ABC transporter substrate-binding protein, partial [Nitrolancea sp.]|nr:ABC transporter substrate-binding protein [Nitrolancea sp.]